MQNKRKKVSHYILKEQLNKGNFGTVYKGIDINTNEPCAIKVISNSNLLTPRQKQGLNREIQIMLNLKHENIVKLYDHMETSNNSYLILELCNNGDLSQFQKGIGEEQTIIYLRQIVKALKVLHEYNIVHRDLKPANIFLSSDSKIKLGDFGLARTVNFENVAETYVGTPFYMSPEVLLVRSNTNERYNFKADIWSLGCIVYELILGERPFQVRELDELIPHITHTVNSPIFLNKKSFSPTCIDFLKKIFKASPDERISFEEMCEHQFILGMPSIKAIVDLTGIQCLSEDLTNLTAEDAIELAQVILKVADLSAHPFLLYMKACMCLKPYPNNEKCKEYMKIVFNKAKNCIQLTE